MRSDPSTHNQPRIRRHPRGLGPHTVALVAISVAAIGACAKVGEDVFNHETAPFDDPIRAWVLAHQRAPAHQAFLLVTHAGAPAVVIPLTAIAAGWLWRRRSMPIASAIVFAPALASALFLALKRVYARARPAGGARLNELTYSFPSGHATAAAAIFLTLAYVLHREKLLGRNPAIALGAIAPLAIGASRVYLDVHWSTDVLGGWSVGALVAGLAAAVYERVRRDTNERGTPWR